MTERIWLEGDSVFIQTNRPDKLLALQQKRWSKPKEAFQSPAILRTLRILADVIPQTAWDADVRDKFAALQVIDEQRERNAHLTTHRDEINLAPMAGVPHGKYAPYIHQQQAYLLARDLPEFGYFMEQGTGKTLTAIQDAAHQWREDRIELAIVVCPNSVKTNWCHPDEKGVCELQTHMPPDVPYVSHVWMTPSNKENKRRQLTFERSLISKNNALHWLVMNIEALGTSRAQDYLQELCEKYKVMLIVDESTRIKTPAAIRTKVMLALARYTVVRRIMSGTPVIKAPEHAWSQLRFLGSDAMPFESVTAFKKRFVLSTRPFGFNGPEKIEGYQNLDELSHLINRVSFRVLKEDCLDLPPKLYSKYHVTMTQVQERAYEEMRKRAYVYLQEHQAEINATIILVQLLRLSQIAAGFLPRIDPDTGKAVDVIPLMPADENPKFKQALEIIEDTEGKLIIWGHYTAQLDMFSSLLTTKKIEHVTFTGAVSDADRVLARERFQNDPACKVFLGNPAAGGIGLTLTAAEAAIYLSNSFKTEDRVQSEDRCHRVGSEIHKKINYHDIVALDTVDEKVLDVLRSNKRLSDQIMGVAWKEWI